jgi:membrane associated rhomboid family serine protease
MLPVGDENEPGYGPAFWTLLFIAINIGVFVLLQLPSDAFTYGFSAIPREITSGVDLVRSVRVDIGGQAVLIPMAPGPKPIQLTLLTSIFMHGGWGHLLGNMLFLYIFGDNVEHAMGRLFYPLFYLAAGVIASLAQVLATPDSVLPTLGASGAISGVLGAYIVLFPRNRVTVFAFYYLISVPAIVAIGLWAVIQFVNGFGSIAETQQTGGGVAYLAHVGGFATGVAVALVLRSLGYGRRSPSVR